MFENRPTLGADELLRTELFRGGALPQVQDILDTCPLVDVEPDKTIIVAGQPNSRMYLVLEGRLRVCLDSPHGAAIAEITRGEVFGDMSVIDGQPTSAFVVSDSTCRLMAVDQDTLWELFRRTPIVANNLLSVLSRRIRRGNELVQKLQHPIA